MVYAGLGRWARVHSVKEEDRRAQFSYVPQRKNVQEGCDSLGPTLPCNHSEKTQRSCRKNYIRLFKARRVIKGGGVMLAEQVRVLPDAGEKKKKYFRRLDKAENITHPNNFKENN